MSFWEELKRRHVVRVAVAYAIVAWLLVQIVVSIEEPLSLPMWTDTFVIVLLAIGFVVALILAWAFELTPDGIASESGSASDSGTETRPRSNTWIATAGLIFGIGVVSFWIYSRDDDVRWLLDEAIPAIEASLDVADWHGAYEIAKEAEQRVPNSEELSELWTRITWRVNIPSDPPGAMVYRQAYESWDGEWELLGTTPLTDIRFPYGLSRLRFELDGHQPLFRTLGGGHINWAELAAGDADGLLVGVDRNKLDTYESLPAEMVRVSGWSENLAGEPTELGDFFIGRHEVTNEEFKAFVDAGGYRQPSLWDPVVFDGAEVPIQEAVAQFVDSTGRHGPSTWIAGDFAAGEKDLPVSGVSWYEASAYARFVGKELPTKHHWQQAFGTAEFPWLLPASNFDGQGPRAVSESKAISFTGAFDMAGNVREWTANAIGEERIILGGSYSDPYYVAAAEEISAPPHDRSPANGIRLALTNDERIAMDRARAPIESSSIISTVEEVDPVSDEVYQAYGRIFSYDPDPLNPLVEDVTETRVWTRERIELDAAYDADRLGLHLYLPTVDSPPFQTVVYWPGWDTFRLDDVDQYFAKQIDFILKSGRAVAFPIYKGTFERKVDGQTSRPPFDTAAYRDNTIDSVKDLKRTIDYLETRRDIDTESFAYFGYSWGGVNGPTAIAQEPRFQLAIINIGLLPPMRSTPEVDPVNALPRVRVPLLMFSGEFDGLVPIENARRYFDLVGVESSNKKHVVVIGGHYIPRDILIRETLDWLDKHLGPTRF